MKYPWMDEYLLSKRGVTKDLQPDWNWIRYHVGGRMFAAILLDREDQPYYINLKLEPLEGEMLRRQYSDVIPGYYSNKQHWNSILPDGEVPEDLLRHLLDRSYRLVLQGFSKSRQREILGISCCGTDCGACSFYGTLCKGCNACGGKVFYRPEGAACPIYACCVNRRRYLTCASCSEMPCTIWRETRDPSMTDEQFEQSIQDRIERLNHIKLIDV
ncbi:MAG: MmcQ/YjbR family DNA-binding protein [Clostridia bacterium]|nr:MmcQ/YjbR family DNA-binding protein [Clostridia bacterium]